MSELEGQIRKAVGRLQWAALRKVLADVAIQIDAEDRRVTIYREGREPLRIGFRDLEKFVNDLH